MEEINYLQIAFFLYICFALTGLILYFIGAVYKIYQIYYKLGRKFKWIRGRYHYVKWKIPNLEKQIEEHKKKKFDEWKKFRSFKR